MIELRFNPDVLRAQLDALRAEEEAVVEPIKAKRRRIEQVLEMAQDPFVLALAAAENAPGADPVAMPTPAASPSLDGRPVQVERATDKLYVSPAYADQKPTQRQTIVVVLREAAVEGRTPGATEITRDLMRRLGIMIRTQSVSSQLAKLEKAGKVKHVGKGWTIAEEASDA